MHPIDQVRCSCLKRREPVPEAPVTSQQLAEQLKQLMADKLDDPTVRQLIERVAEVVRKRER